MNEPAMKETLSNNALTAEELKLAQLIVSSLNLEMQAAEIDPAAPLYGEKAYGVKLRSDDELNRKIFTSLRSLSQHIQQHRVK